MVDFFAFSAKVNLADLRILLGAVHIVCTHENVENWIPPPPLYAMVCFTTDPPPCKYVLSFHLLPPLEKLKTRLTGPKIYPLPSAVHLRSLIVNKKKFGNKNCNDQ